MLFLFSWSLQPLWSAPRLHLNGAQQCFPLVLKDEPHLISIHPTCDFFFFMEYRWFASLSSSSAKTDPEKHSKNKQKPSSASIPPVLLCPCPNNSSQLPGIKPTLLHFPLAAKAPPRAHLPTHRAPAPQATRYGQVVLSASLYIRYLTQLVFSVMIWGATYTQTDPASSVRLSVYKLPTNWYFRSRQMISISMFNIWRVMQKSVQTCFGLLLSACPLWFFCQ